jgi:hypothetical protein
MLRKDLPTVEVSIDERYSEGQDLGIDLISNVKNPAVKIKGVAFSNQEHSKYCFSDFKKFRIAAPALVPDDIYRNDEDGEYFIRFTPEKIEQLAKKFMSQLPTKGNRIFNLEHGEELIDSYILEAILADTESKVEMIKESYEVEVPLGTFFIVQQFNDKNKFEELVSKGQIGFSIEGFLGMELIDNKNQIKQSKMKKDSKLTKMKRKQKFVGVKRTFKSASKRKFEEVIENEELIVIVDELVEGAEAVVVEDVTEGPIDNFTGEVEVVVEGVTETLIIEEGVVTEIVVEETTEEVAMQTEEEKKEEVSMETTEEVKEEELQEEEVVEAPSNDVESKFEEIYSMIAELKAEIELMKNPTVEEEVVMKKNFSSALITFNQKFSDED